MTSRPVRSASMLGDVNPWVYFTQNRDQIQGYLLQHVVLTFVAVGLGLLISVPLAVVVSRRKVVRTAAVGVSGLLYVIPSVSFFVIVGAWLSYIPPASYKTAELGLVSYTLLFLVWNTLAGFDAVPADARESAIAMGYTNTAVLLRVDLPLAIPYIIAGLRVATPSTIAAVTVTSFVGLGGLGQLFVYGFNASYYAPIIDGLVLCLVLAAVCDVALVALGRVIAPWSRSVGRVGSRA
jgi:osmoprotectant transport system permease protein